MPSRSRSGFALLLAAALAPAALAAQPAGFLDALRASRPVLELRYRYEDVAEDALPGRHARASTLRTVLGLETGAWRGFSLRVVAEDVSTVGPDLYDNAGAAGSGNEVTDRPVVADPEGTEIHQAFLRWQGERADVRAGRQEIVLGDARFVGNVGWRQNHQSYDAVRIDAPLGARLRLTYAYLDRVNRINRASDAVSSHLANLRADLGAWGGLTLYGYLLDYEDSARAGLSSTTWGAELAGERKLGAERGLTYQLEYAVQSDAADNPGRIDADYAFLSLGYRSSPVGVRVGFERLGGSARDGRFSTPLATAHAYNGWADKFLVTPADGLEDLHLEIGGELRGVRWLARRHEFRAATGGASYGREIDLQLLYRASWGQRFGIKAALYDADGFSTDTEKWMLWTEFDL